MDAEELVLVPGVSRPRPARRWMGRRARPADPTLQWALPLIWAAPPAELSQAKLDELLLLSRWHLSLKFARDPAWEDILSEGYIGALAAIRRVQVTGACSLATAATKGATWGAMSYLRSAANPERRFSRKGHALPFVVALTERDEEDEERERDDLPTAPDFADELVAHLEAEEQVGHWLKHPALSALERAILTRVVMHEEPAGRVAGELGITPARLASLKRQALQTLKGESDDGHLCHRGDGDGAFDAGRPGGRA